MEIVSIAPFLAYLQKIRERTTRVIDVVPPEYMDWAYKPGKFTIADQIRHIAAMERYMFAENVAGRPSAYTGCSAEITAGYDGAVDYFVQMHNESVAIFNNLTDTDLKETCFTPAGTPLTIAKWLRAMVEHEVHHRGQLYIYLNILGVKTPPMFGLTAEEVGATGVSNR